jgi:rhodanese-related sulfurtransferase
MKVLIQALLVAVVGIVLAFCANGLSPRGLSLTTNFFPATPAKQPSQPQVSSGAVAAVPGTMTNSEIDQLTATLKAQGLGLATTDKAIALFHDPRRAQNLVVFIDARHDEEYQAGHIPGAYQFDYFYENKFLGAVVPVIQGAEQVIVYCKGGECQDSLNAAIMLGNFIPKEKLMVHSGGITEWMAKGMEIETGERNSGKVHKAP